MKRSCTMPVAEQLADLARLEPGWLDGDGGGYDSTQLAGLEGWLDTQLARHGLPTPFIYPTPEGDVRAEWSADGWEISVTVDLTAWVARLLVAGVESNEVVELVVSMHESAALGALHDYLAPSV